MSNDKTKAPSDEKENINVDQKKVCGIVMPISEIEGLPKSHWDEVYTIISDSIESAGFTPNLVSNSEDIGVIQKRIVQNLYENPIVVCDVSAKNPNVMFELGLRLAFDKPTIIIKDDKTSYSFDTSPIEHLEYPRDLRFSKIKDFGDRLESKIKSTYQKSVDDKDYSTFLKHFGTFKVAKIETEEVTKEDLLMEEMKSIRNLILRDANMRGRSTQDRFKDLGIEINELSDPPDHLYVLFKKASIVKQGMRPEIDKFQRLLLDTKGIFGIISQKDMGAAFEIVARLDNIRSKSAIIKELGSKYGQQILQMR